MATRQNLSGIFTVAFVFIGISRAASFDCTKAHTKTEKLICSAPALSKADDAMAAAYKKAMAAVANLTSTEQNDLKQDQLFWLKYRVAECVGKPMAFGEPMPTGAPCIAEQYKLRTAALEMYATQKALGSSQPVDPTGTFNMFGVCLSCGDSSVGFEKRPNGAVRFVLSANNGKNLGDAGGEIKIAGNVGTYTDADTDCSLTFTFTHATVTVKQKGDCGFGYGVRADGYYLKTSNAVPKMDQ